jgi:Co/Zn/Cd efflux system component
MLGFGSIADGHRRSLGNHALVVGLIRDAGAVLLDVIPEGEGLPDGMREALEGESDRITDLHIWQIGPGRHAAIISVATAAPKAPSAYNDRLSHLHELSHVTVEVQPLPA